MAQQPAPPRPTKAPSDGGGCTSCGVTSFAAIQDCQRISCPYWLSKVAAERKQDPTLTQTPEVIMPPAPRDDPPFEDLTLRDWFAGQALVHAPWGIAAESKAQHAYKIADAMMTERKKT